jgi:L-malate glycosyltransferase
MNILIAIPCLSRGGTEMQTLNLVKILVRSGYSLTTLCYFEYHQAMVDEFNEAGCTLELMKLDRSILPWQLVGMLRKRFKTLRPDVVHVQYMAPGALPILAARLAGVKKIIATVHQPHTPSHGRLAKLILRISALLCTRFIVVSKNAEISWFGNGQLFDDTKSLNSQPRHFTIYNAVDVAQIQTIHIKSPEPSLKKLVIGVVSRLRHEKGIDILINAFALVVKQLPHIHLLIVGSGPDEETLKEQAHDLNLESMITFFGEANWETAMEQMALMNIVVVPSRFEGFGLTAAEAMAMDKPVVASNVFGLSEVVSDGGTGLLFPNEDTSALAECLVQLCQNHDQRVQMGSQGMLKATELFDLTVYARKTTQLYESLNY